MPYSDISQLPEPVRNSLPQHGQSIWMAAYNSAKEQGKDEETCAKIAWGAVKKSYEKVGDKWQVIGNLDSPIINSDNEITNADHDVVLQRLNQKIHYKEYGDVFYPVGLFQEMGNKWDGIPLIFGKDHPDFTLFTQNPELALKQIGGCIVGKVTNPRVDTVGTPKFMGNFQIDNPVIENLIQSGKIAHSTGFRFKVDDKNTLTSMFPHHVLLFTQDKYNNPVDAGAMILNKEEVDIMTEDGVPSVIKNKDSKKPYGDVEYADPGYQEDGVYRYPIDTKAHADAAWKYINMPKNQNAYTADQLANIKAKIRAAAKKHGIEISNKETEDKMAEDKEVELTKQLEISNKEKETLTGQVEGLKTEIANKTEQLKVFEQNEANRKAAEETALWLEIKNKLGETGQAGLIHKSEDEATLKSMWIANKDAFYMKHFVNATKPELPGKEGRAIVNADIDLDKPGEGAKIGDYDPKTQEWK